MPYGLLVYRSCYPIQTVEGEITSCSKNSTSVNVRIYSLNISEYLSYMTRSPVYRLYDVWRELGFYEYIREEIIKKKICPNFVTMHTFMFSKNHDIDFFKLKNKELTQRDFNTGEYQRFMAVHHRKPLVQRMAEDINKHHHVINDVIPAKTVVKLPDEVDPRLQLYSGNCMVILTESYNNNIYTWASRIYEYLGAVRKQTSHGFHEDYIWKNLIFQILAGMATLQDKGILIRDMTLDDNIFVKDLQTNINYGGYWKYIIGGITYYIPNYGFLAMIDSNYKDIPYSSHVVQPKNRVYKLYMNQIYPDKRFDDNNLKKEIGLNVKNIFSNAFGKEYTKNYVNKPPASIMNLMEQICDDIEKGETNISKLIFKHMQSFMHNRIGLPLKKNIETENVLSVKSDEKMKIGTMCVFNNNDSYCWALIVDNHVGGYKILTKKNPEDVLNIVIDVTFGEIFKYQFGETIEQTIIKTKLNENPVNFSEENLLETYRIN
jgi:hypothetical protein